MAGVRGILAIPAVVLAAMVVFGAVLVVTEPVGDSVADRVVDGGPRSPVFEWSAPVYQTPSATIPSGWTQETITIDISESEYRASISRPTIRHSTAMDRGCAHMVDPDDPFVRTIASYLGDLDYGSDQQRVTAALDFVCSIPYRQDIDVYGVSEFWAYPLETLFAHAGDCEDKSILLCSILVAMGIDAVILDMPSHVAVGVSVDGISGKGFTDDSGKTYWYCETTGFAPATPGFMPSWAGDVTILHPSEVSFFGHLIAQYRALIHDLVEL